MIELASVLAIPLVTALLLALFGHHRSAPEVNSAGSLLTLIAAGLLTVRVISDGPMTEPPQKCPPLSCSETCHGTSVMLIGSPPTIE